MTKAPIPATDVSASPLQFDAVIFDMDGVVTNTATLHAAAWKELFDDYLKMREARNREPFQPFDAQADYLTYVDGKSRYEGVKSFLESRGISLPYGAATDSPEQETCCGLGNKKDQFFEERLHSNGVELFESTIALINALRASRIKVAIVSSSTHCQQIVKMAGIERLFDARVDGKVSKALGLKGKPNPDIFTKSAEMLGADRRRTAVVEDAISGVQAGRAGGFGLVIGVDRANQSERLKASGADWVVTDLSEVSLDTVNEWFAARQSPLPSALEKTKEIGQRLAGKRVALFLDYDGTLAAIAPRPELAVISDEMRETVRQISAYCTTAIVSGRSMDDARALVQLPQLYYAGNHGFEISGPDHTTIRHEAGKEFVTAMAAIHDRLVKQIKPLSGAFVENKRYSLSIHFRLLADGRMADLETIVDHALADFPTLRKHHGKKVFEIRPKIDWHKGKAVTWLLQALKLDRPDVVPIYVGDDVTDEDAFRAIAVRGFGVLVTQESRPSAASYTLQSPGEVKQFLEALMTHLRDDRS